MTGTIVSLAAVWSRSSTRFARCTVWASGSEIVTLLIPGFNDSADELDRLTSFVAGVSPDIPWHVTAFHKDYRMSDPENTTPEMLVGAASDRSAERLALRLCGQHPGGSGTWRTRAATRAARCSSSATGITCAAIASRLRGVARTAARRFRAAGRSLRRPDQRDAVPARESPPAPDLTKIEVDRGREAI